MKNVAKSEDKKVPAVRINPELNKYDDVILFPKKVQMAKEYFAKHGIPDFVKKKKQQD